MGDVLYGCSNAGGIHIRDESYPNRSLCWVYLIDGLVDPGDRHVCGTCTRTHAARGRQDAPADPTPVPAVTREVPFDARRAMQQALWDECISPGDNEWTTWTDSIALAECAARALVAAGYEVTLAEAPQPKVLWEGETARWSRHQAKASVVASPPLPVPAGTRVLVAEAPASKEDTADGR